MPSHRAQVVPRYPEGYRTMPRNSGARPGSVCGYPTSTYKRGAGNSIGVGGGGGSNYHTLTTATAQEKRRSMRDDTMWQLYEWQQRQVMSQRQTYATLPSPRTMADIAEHAAAPGARASIAQSIPPSPSHGSLGGGIYHTYSPRRSSHNHATCSEMSSPIYRGDLSIDRRHRVHPTKVKQRNTLNPLSLPCVPFISSQSRGFMQTQEFVYDVFNGHSMLSLKFSHVTF